MSETHAFEVEGRQRALIAWLAEHCGTSGHLGKTAFQKLVYATTEICGVDTGYEFKIYTYGPFSRDLAGDLDSADRSGIIAIEYLTNENRYKLQAGSQAAVVIDQCQDFIATNLPYLNWVSENLGNRSARYLELFSTLHFIVRTEQDLSDNKAVDDLLSLKPKFERGEVAACLQKVREVITSLEPLDPAKSGRLPSYSLDS